MAARGAAAIALGLVLSGCATGYKPEGIGGGYTDLRLNETTYQVHVAGNGYTSDSRSGELALMRAADLTLQAGYSRFLVTSGGTQSAVVGSTPLVANQVGSTVFVSGGDDIVKPSSNLTIQMLRPADPGYAGAIDAKLIFGQLKAKFG